MKKLSQVVLASFHEMRRRRHPIEEPTVDVLVSTSDLRDELWRCCVSDLPGVTVDACCRALVNLRKARRLNLSNSEAGRLVYFALDEASMAVKIGYATNVGRRMEALQTSNPNKLVLLGTIPGGNGIESQIHDFFRYAKIRGEWFRSDPLVLTQIEGILQDGWPIP